MTITFSQIDALDPCWTVEELASRLPADDTPVELTLDSLLSLSLPDARWLVTNLMTRQQLITWANACAERAKGYAAADADAADAAAYSAAAADAVAVADADAAWAAAADAAADADAAAAAADAAVAARAAAAAARAAAAVRAAAARAAEHRKAMEHALQLLNS